MFLHYLTLNIHYTVKTDTLSLIFGSLFTNIPCVSQWNDTVLIYVMTQCYIRSGNMSRPSTMSSISTRISLMSSFTDIRVRFTDRMRGFNSVQTQRERLWDDISIITYSIVVSCPYYSTDHRCVYSTDHRCVTTFRMMINKQVRQ